MDDFEAGQMTCWKILGLDVPEINLFLDEELYETQQHHQHNLDARIHSPLSTNPGYGLTSELGNRFDGPASAVSEMMIVDDVIVV